jgi:hypothetical protein
MDTEGIIAHAITIPAWWTLFELVYLGLFSFHGWYLHKKKGWFAEPVSGQAMFWELFIAGALTTFLTTDFQLEGLFFILKYHYVKEVWKHDHILRNMFLLALAAVVMIAIAL